MANAILALYVLITSAGLIVLKLGTRIGAPFSFAGDKFSLNLNWLTVVGILIFGISFLLYIYLISKFDLGYIIPVTASLVYILVFTASFLVFKESFTAMKVAGIVLILAGLFLLNLGK